jgi:hypothetical protein
VIEFEGVGGGGVEVVVDCFGGWKRRDVSKLKLKRVVVLTQRRPTDSPTRPHCMRFDGCAFESDSVQRIHWERMCRAM